MPFPLLSKDALQSCAVSELLKGTKGQQYAEVTIAGEKPILGASGRDLYGQLSLKTNVQVTFAEFIADVPQVLDDLVEPGDLVLTQGAGETAQLAQALTKRWQDWRLRT